MKCRDRNLIIGVIIVGVLAILGAGIPNLPDKYEEVIANEVGAPLDINEVWKEQGIFEVKINEMKEIPIDSLRIGDGETEYHLLKQVGSDINVRPTESRV